MTVFKSMILCLGLFAASSAQANGPYVQIDASYVVETYGPAIPHNGKTYYPIVFLHKIYVSEGKTFICVAFKGLPNPEFARHSKIVSSAGTVIGKGFEQHTEHSFLAPGSISGRVNGRPITLLPADISSYVGQKIRCKRSARRPSPEFTDGKSRIVIPERVRVRIEQ